MQSVPLISGSVLRPLLDYLERVDGGLGLDVLGQAAAPLRDTRGLVPFLLGGLAFARAAELLAAPELGLRIVESSPVEGIGEFGELVRSAPTVGAALAACVQLAPRFHTGARFWLSVRGEEAWFHRCFARSFQIGRTQVSDFGVGLILKLIQLATGPGWRPREIRFEIPRPAHAEQLAALAETVRFGERSTAIVFPRSVLAMALPPFIAPRRKPGGAEPSTDVAASLRQTVDALVRLGRASLPAVAEAAGTSARSLQRRLAESGQSFQGLLEQARCRAAFRLLAEHERKVIDVSIALGYSDGANFTRAFRRWTGVSPQEFRRVSLERPAFASVSAAAR